LLHFGLGNCFLDGRFGCYFLLFLLLLFLNLLLHFLLLNLLLLLFSLLCSVVCDLDGLLLSLHLLHFFFLLFLLLFGFLNNLLLIFYGFCGVFCLFLKFPGLLVSLDSFCNSLSLGGFISFALLLLLDDSFLIFLFSFNLLFDDFWFDWLLLLNFLLSISLCRFLGNRDRNFLLPAFDFLCLKSLLGFLNLFDLLPGIISSLFGDLFLFLDYLLWSFGWR